MSAPRTARTLAGVLVIAAILAGYLTRVTRSQSLPPWLVLLVSVLGLAAGAAVFGRDAMAVGARLFGNGGP